MGRPPQKHAPKQLSAQKNGRNGRGQNSSSKHALYAGALGGFAILGASAVVGAFWMKDRLPREPPSPPAPVVDRTEPAAGLGPETMEQQAPLLNRLLALLGEVEKFTPDDQPEERRAAAERVEAELKSIEAQMTDTTSVGGSQSAALISIVRSALQADGRGEEDMGENWSDENLQKEHGFVTYANQEYWDQSYSNQKYGESFDWASSWTKPSLRDNTTLSELVRPLVPKDARILVLGCGNSNMSVIMHEEGYTDITNIDFSSAAIDIMQKQYGHLPGMSWLQMDASNLTFDNGTFDVVMEKSLFDALFAGTGIKADKVLAEAWRVLRPAGKLLSIAFTGERLKSLLDAGWHAPRDPDDGSEVEPNTAATEACDIAGQLEHMKKKEADILHVYVYRCLKT